MIILGLDPGIARTGFGLVRANNPPTFIRCGCLTTPAQDNTSDRLSSLGQDLTQLIKQFHPDQAVIETVLFGKNVKTAMFTAETRGALIYVLRQYNIPVFNLTPLQIKSRITGYGAATKQQIQSMVVKRLGLSSPPQPDDAADGLAAALCLAEESLTLSTINTSIY
jgi:crossover junction endodeoxyribonuclease RuvC